MPGSDFLTRFELRKIIVIGGGAAGMAAAVFAARNGADVVLLERNEKLGKKLFITGKGRCNITNAADLEDFFSAIALLLFLLCIVSSAGPGLPTRSACLESLINSAC